MQDEKTSPGQQMIVANGPGGIPVWANQLSDNGCEWLTT